MSHKVIRPFSLDIGYTQIHNYVFDHMMPELSGSEWKILSFILRCTRGWQRDHDRISISRIMGGTGINSKTTVTQATEKLISLKYITKITSTNGVDSSLYLLNVDYEVVQELDNLDILGSPKNGQGVVQKMDTQKKESKQIEDDDDGYVETLGTENFPPGGSNEPSPLPAKEEPDYVAIDEGGDELRDLSTEALLLRCWKATLSYKLKGTSKRPDQKYYSSAQELQRKMKKDSRWAAFLNHQIEWCYNNGNPQVAAKRFFELSLDPAIFQKYLDNPDSTPNDDFDSTKMVSNPVNRRRDRPSSTPYKPLPPPPIDPEHEAYLRQQEF